MIVRLAAAATLAALPVAAPAAAELRIGFVNSLSGGGALLGRAQLNGFRLGMTHEGWTKDGDRLGGVATRLFVADDQRKPDVGLRAVRRMINRERVHIVSGIMFSHVLMAVQRMVIRSKRILLTTNAGASPMSGPLCNPYFLASSFNNDQFGESLGHLVSKVGAKRIYALAPNFQAGKDMIAGFQRFLKGGKIIGQTLFQLGQRDFQAHISRIRAAKPDAIYVFAPGGMGISFLKQWQAAGIKGVQVFTVAAVDWLTLRPIGKAAVGSYHTAHWNADLKNPENERFVRAYRATYKRPPTFYAAQAYDAARLIAAAVRKVDGKVDDTLALAKAMRRSGFKSVRGNLSFNVNGIPIQNWYRREVVAGPDGRLRIVTTGTVFKAKKDSYWQRCPKKNRL